jgi:hypothetical protein
MPFTFNGNRGVRRGAFVALSFFVASGFHCKREEAQGTRTTSAASAPRQPVDLPPPAKPDPLPLRVGQWIRQRTLEGGRDGTHSLKIVAQQSGAFWFEVVTGAADAGTVVQILMDAKDRKDKNTADIRSARVRMPNGLIKELTGPMLEPNKPGYRQLLQSVFGFGEAPEAREDVTVPAGTFRGCYRVEREKTKFWIHPAVPLTGIVKSEGPDTRLELMDFGLDGAVSELEKENR